MEAAGTPVVLGGSNHPVPVDPTIDVKIAEMDDQTLGSKMIHFKMEIFQSTEVYLN